jgi:hypothetical protein
MRLPIALSADEMTTMETWACIRTLPACIIGRAQTVRLAAHGVPKQEIAQRLGVLRPTVQLWHEPQEKPNHNKQDALAATRPAQASLASCAPSAVSTERVLQPRRPSVSEPAEVIINLSWR